MTSLRAQFQEFRRQLSLLDLGAMALFVIGAGVFLAGGSGGALSFLKFLGAIAGFYLVFRIVAWWRTRLLWSLRNRLIVAYLFIAVVPILLIVALVVITGRILYSQLGAYLLYEDIHDRIERVADIGEHIAAAHSALPKGISMEESERILAAQSHTVHDNELPGLKITFSNDVSLLQKIAGGKNSFAGLLQEEDKISLTSIRAMKEERGVRVVRLDVPLTPEFLAAIAPDVGAIQMNLMERFDGGVPKSVLYTSAGVQYTTARRIVAKNRILQPAILWIDMPVNAVSRLDSAYVGKDGKVELTRPVLAVFNARPSRLNSRIFTSLGELRDTYLIVLIVVGVAFLLIELVALITGIVLTRRITRAVSGLYHATEFVQSGDFSHRVLVEKQDQLGVLGESFNRMTKSVGDLIEEQKRRERLENEISIAREVQNQLFPQNLPSVPGVEIEAICKAARSVSGDYYDFIQLSPTHLAIAIADISGKGISAALLMASLQAALRSQILTQDCAVTSTADLVARLNNHLVRNTADDRFATFFVAVYDSATRTLRYTNAGHLPSFLIGNGSSVHLDKGGMVLGIVEDYVYEQGSLSVPPGALLVGYSDGLVEPENVYGEEFGIRRLEDAAVRVQATAPMMVAESLMAAAEEWAGTPEQADDMTVVVARLR